MRRIAALAGVALLVAGCGALPSVVVPTPSSAVGPTLAASSTRAAAGTRPASRTATPAPAVTVRGLSTAPAAARNPVLAAAADLAERLGLPESAEVSVVSVAPRDWPDSSLGCPQEGKLYAQVITPGYVVVLEVEEERYEYHTDSRSSTVPCAEGTPVAGKGVSPTVKDGSPNQPIQGGEVDTSRVTPVPRQ